MSQEIKSLFHPGGVQLMGDVFEAFSFPLSETSVVV